MTGSRFLSQSNGSGTTLLFVSNSTRALSPVVSLIRPRIPLLVPLMMTTLVLIKCR